MKVAPASELNENEAAAAFVRLAGELVIEALAAVVSISHVKLAGDASWFPSESAVATSSTARTRWLSTSYKPNHSRFRSNANTFREKPTRFRDDL